MKATQLILIALLLASSAFADSDIAVTLDAPSTARPGDTVNWSGTVSNLGPDLATNVRVRMELSSYEACVNMTIATLAAGETRRFTCRNVLRPELTPVFDAFLYALSIFIRADAEGIQDRKLQNNGAGQYLDLVTDPDLAVAAYVVPGAAPGLPMPFKVHYANIARTTATGVTVKITAPGEITSAPDFCVRSGNRATCTIGSIAPTEHPFNPRYHDFDIAFVTPDASEQAFTIRLEIDGDQPDVYPASDVETVAGSTARTFFVTNANDSGDGSLRAAMTAANGSCSKDGVACRIAFRIPDATGPWQTIKLESPLPGVTADNLLLDATTQSRYFTDTNPVGPEIELDGSRLTGGHGLDIQSPCETEVAGLAINGFPGVGIYVHTPGECTQAYSNVRQIHDNTIGTDPTGMRAIPNARGIYVAVGDRTTSMQIYRNVISGNRHAGVFIERGRAMIIANNTIGLNRTITAGLGNGASGIYLDLVTHATDINDNYIGFNAHAGVAIRHGAYYVGINGNSFQANGGLAIDHGLDGVSETMRSPHQSVPLPVITSARFGNGETIIEGTVDASMARVNVYANDALDPSGYGEGQYTLGSVEPVNRQFKLVHKGDLRGKWIAATTTFIEYYGLGVHGVTASTTSEFGRAVQCAP